jgi:lipoprotein signal peptidase
VTSNLSPGESIQVIGDYLRIVFGQNTGALFGLFKDNAAMFGIVSLAVIALIVIYEARAGTGLYLTVTLGLLLGGCDREHARPAAARLRRRLRRRRIGGTRFYTFNVADSAISLAILLLFIAALRPSLIDGGRRPRSRRDPLRVLPGRSPRATRTRGTRTLPTRPRRRSAVTGPGIHTLEVPAGAATQRVDRWVADVTGLSRSHVQKLISSGNLTADGLPLKANAVVGPGAALRLVVPEPVPLTWRPRRRSRSGWSTRTPTC